MDLDWEDYETMYETVFENDILVQNLNGPGNGGVQTFAKVSSSSSITAYIQRLISMRDMTS